MENLRSLMEELVDIAYGQDCLLHILDKLTDTYHENEEGKSEAQSLAYFVWYYLGRQRKDLQGSINELDYFLIHLSKEKKASTGQKSPCPEGERPMSAAEAKLPEPLLPKSSYPSGTSC